MPSSFLSFLTDTLKNLSQNILMISVCVCVCVCVLLKGSGNNNIKEAEIMKNVLGVWVIVILPI